MAQDQLYVARWTLVNGHTVSTLTDEPSYRRWARDPHGYSRKRLERWNSPNRKPGSARLAKAKAFQIVVYEPSRSSAGIAPVEPGPYHTTELKRSSA